MIFRVLLLLAVAVGLASAREVYLDTLDISGIRQARVLAHAKRNTVGNPMFIAGQAFERGIGTHSFSYWRLFLNGGSTRFTADVGVDDASGKGGTVIFEVIVDGRTLYSSSLMKSGDTARHVDVDVSGAKWLVLRIGDGGDDINADLANWGNARLMVQGVDPKPVALVHEEPVFLTPPPPVKPRINGPKVYGCQPGNPFLYRIPVQGERPLRYRASGLPDTLSLDAGSGIITGVAPERGEYRTRLEARNTHGKSVREFRIISGDTLALTPTLGWNHWNAWYDKITDQKVREAADIMLTNGMAEVGFDHILIDDCWMNAVEQRDPLRVGPARSSSGEILPNRHFPDMKALTTYLHSKGWKAGIYSSPGPTTCGGFAGSYQHEAQDARQFADWGFDFLKYDWCSYDMVVRADHSVPALQKPYLIMAEALRNQKRDIVFNLCQYGMGEVWKWGDKVGGHSWRTGYDLGYELDWIIDVALRNVRLRDFQKPGRWNDADYIQVGWVGDPRDMGAPKPCPLTPSEQYSFASLWALMSTPFVYSGDLGRMDAFTRNILCNAEVIEINQDSLGQCARAIHLSEGKILFVKDLDNGDTALGLCNWGEFAEKMTANLSLAGIKGSANVRDVWRQQDLGRHKNGVTFEVPRHGVVLLRLSR